MVIDPRLYEKVTGRRPGEAQEQAALTNAKLASKPKRERNADNVLEEGVKGYIKGRLIIAAIFWMLMLIIGISMLLSPSRLKNWWGKITGNTTQSAPGPGMVP
jgi:hypothetical protein